MHIERIHEMIEKLTECAKTELDKGVEQVDTEELGAVIDMIKDLACAEKESKITAAMTEAEKEQELMEKFGVDDEMRYYGGDGRRYYDNYRYSNGRFAPKGRGSYRPSRRGYEEMPYLHMAEGEYAPEYMRDMDRAQGRMYYSSGSGSSGGNSGGSSGNSGGSSGMSGGSGSFSGGAGSSGGQRGYSSPMSDGGNRNESRSERARRNYTETKEMHRDNTPNDKQANMASLEEYTKELSGDLTELVKDMSQDEKELLKKKITLLANKIV